MTYEEFKEKVGSVILTGEGNCPVTPVVQMLQGSPAHRAAAFLRSTTRNSNAYQDHFSSATIAYLSLHSA